MIGYCMKKVLVTGGSGFVGSYLLPELAKKYYVACLSRTAKNSGAESIQGDITNENDVLRAVKGMDAVIHLAASVSSKDTDANYRVNVLGAKNLVKACRQEGVKRVIFTSTFMAVKENQCNYGKTKAEAEDVFRHSGLDVTILRPELVYGIGGKGFTKIVQNVQRFPLFIPLIGKGKHTRQPVWVGDVVQAILTTLEKDISISKEYYLGGPAPLPFREIVRHIAQELKVRKVLVPLPASLCYALAGVLEALIPHSPVTKRDIISINQSTTVDITDTKNDLNYNPLSFTEGIKRVLGNR